MRPIDVYRGEVDVRLTLDDLTLIGNMLRKGAEASPESPSADTAQDMADELDDLAGQAGKALRIARPPRRRRVILRDVIGDEGMAERHREAEESRASMPTRRRPTDAPVRYK